MTLEDKYVVSTFFNAIAIDIIYKVSFTCLLATILTHEPVWLGNIRWR